MDTFLAPELIVSQWLNTDSPLSLSALRGRVVVIEVFQMLCPGCVSRGLPQALAAAEAFEDADVTVLGLHSVFEHHEAQGPRIALEAFLHEYRIPFPVAIDQPSEESRFPLTMAKYRFKGTPSLLLIDREGYLRTHHFGALPDLTLGAEIMRLVGESPVPQSPTSISEEKGGICDSNGCPIR